MTIRQMPGRLALGILISSLILVACSGGSGTSSSTSTGSNSNSSSNTGNNSGSTTTTNTAPQASSLAVTVEEDTAKTITLKGSDAEGNALTYTVVAQPAHGTVSVSGSSAVYTPAANYQGTDTFTYQASDGALTSTAAAIQITVQAVNDAPVAESLSASAIAGIAKNIDLRGSDVDDPVTALVASITAQPQHGTVTLSGLRATYKADSTTTAGQDTFSYTLSDGKTVSAAATVSISIAAGGMLQPTPTGKLNDTGVTLCGDYAYNASGTTVTGHVHNSDVACTLLTDADNDPIPAGQDGMVGRDVQDNDNTDGRAGFSFTKIGSNGQALSADATEWSCVKDNVTGLIWEAKTDDGGLHDKDWKYSWYNPDNTKNGGSAGVQNGGYCGGTSSCDTEGFVQAVNAQGWCGANDWRMPKVNELQMIADHSRHDPAIDTDYFPHTAPWVYWSGTPYVDYAGSDYYAWFVGFNGGADNWVTSRGFDGHVRLVRSGH